MNKNEKARDLAADNKYPRIIDRTSQVLLSEAQDGCCGAFKAGWDAHAAYSAERMARAIEHIANARSECTSTNATKDYIIDECCLAIAVLDELLGEK